MEADDNIMKQHRHPCVGQYAQNTDRRHAQLLDAYEDIYYHLSLTKVYASASARVDVLDLLKSDNRLTFNRSSSADVQAEVETPK